MSTDRDLFANFERMRRDMDELFGDVFGGGGGRGSRSRGAFTPAVDVYYVADPPRAVVRAELAGVRAAEIELEIQHGPFRRVISLGADVDADAAKATFEDGVLTVELPIRAPQGARHVPVRRADES